MTNPKRSTDSPPTRVSLILHLQNEQDDAAWREFVTVYESFLMRLIQRRGVPATHVSDVTNQVLSAIARSIAQWKDDQQDASFRRWISRVARNVVIKYMSNERRHVSAVGGTDALESLGQLPAPLNDEIEHQYEHELIVWAAEQVKGEFIDTSWQAFWMTMIEGRAVADVAQTLAVSPGSIYMSRGRILKRIRDKVIEVMEPS
jgi:RNA polymerase sigma-70 factor, ECF subfamily